MSHSAYGIKIAVKPDNPDFVFAGTITSSVSLDGGLTGNHPSEDTISVVLILIQTVPESVHHK